MIPKTNFPPQSVSSSFPVDLPSALAERRNKTNPTRKAWVEFVFHAIVGSIVIGTLLAGYANKANAAVIYEYVPETLPSTHSEAVTDSRWGYSGSSAYIYLPQIVSGQTISSLRLLAASQSSFSGAYVNQICIFDTVTSSTRECTSTPAGPSNSLSPDPNPSTNLAGDPPGALEELQLTTPYEIDTLGSNEVVRIQITPEGGYIGGYGDDWSLGTYGDYSTVMTNELPMVLWGAGSTIPEIYISDDGSYESGGISGGANLLLTITEPEAFSSTASTTFSVGVRYQRGTAPLTGYELRLVHLASGAVDTFNFFLDPVEVGTIETIYEDVEVLYEGTYSLQATLFSGYSTSTPSLPKVKQYGQGSSMIQFAVVEPDIPFDYDSVPGYSNPSFSAESCTLDWELDFSLGDCLGYLFVPSNNSFAQYRTLTLADSFPFAYAYQLPDIKDALYNNANLEDQAITVEILGGELTFLSRDMVAAVPFAPTIREMLSAVMWFLLAYALYKMVIKAHDSNTYA